MATAIKCKHCGERLDTTLRAEKTKTPVFQPREVARRTDNKPPLKVVAIASAVVILVFCVICSSLINTKGGRQEPIFNQAANDERGRKNAEAKAQAEIKRKEVEEQRATLEAERKAKLEEERKKREQEAAKPKHGTLRGPGNVPVAISKAAWNRWTTSKDLDENDRLLDTGQVWHIQGGTKVNILYKGLFYCELLVLEGKDKDRTVWTSLQFLQE